jgi:hypothetical protein
MILMQVITGKLLYSVPTKVVAVFTLLTNNTRRWHYSIYKSNKCCNVAYYLLLYHRIQAYQSFFFLFTFSNVIIRHYFVSSCLAMDLSLELLLNGSTWHSQHNSGQFEHFKYIFECLGVHYF